MRKYPLVVVITLLAVACIAIWTAAYAQGSAGSGVVTFAVLNIGQGDALFIEGPTGIQLLIDAGPNTGAVLSELARVMPLGDRSLDAAIETHPDADHMGGFVDVLDRYKVSAFISPGIVKGNTLTDALGKEIAEQKVPVYIARRGMVLDLGGGAKLDILYPDTDVSGWGNKTNDGSIVARLVYGKTSAILTGDIAFNTEAHLVEALGTELDSDLLKVGHHGSKTSSSEQFIAAVKPDTALISVGAKNSYGHPTKEVLGRLESASVPVLRTDQEGTIICTSDLQRFTCK